MSGEDASRVNKTPEIPHPAASTRLGLVAAGRAMQDSGRVTPERAEGQPLANNLLFLFEFELRKGE
jgi:hypothetical protein